MSRITDIMIASFFRLQPSNFLNTTFCNSDIKGAFDKMDQDQNGVITIVEIDADMKEFLEYQNNTETEGKKNSLAAFFNDVIINSFSIYSSL